MAEPFEDNELATPRDLLNRGLHIIRRGTRFWPAVAIAGVIGLPLAIMAPKVLKPMYRSETVLLYRQGIRTAGVLGNQGGGRSSRRRGSRLKEMLMSRSSLEKIIKQYKLYGGAVTPAGLGEAVVKLRKNAQCKVRDGDTFRIAFQGDDPEVVLKVTKRFGEALIEESTRLRVQTAEATRDFLATEKTRADVELKTKEEALATFLAEHPEFANDAGVKGGTSSVGVSVRAAKKSKLGPIGTTPSIPGRPVDPGLQALRRQAARIRERLKSPNASAAPAVKADPALVAKRDSARNALDGANAKLAAMRRRYTDAHPDVASARGQVAAAKSRLAAAESAVRRSLAANRANAKAPVSTKSKAQLEEELKKIEARISARISRKKKAKKAAVNGDKTPDPEPAPEPVKYDSEENRIVVLETQWNRLNREVAQARERVQALQDRLFKATIAASVESSGKSSQMVVIDPAYRPARPQKRGKKRVMAGTLAAFLFLGGLVAAVMTLFDERVYHAYALRSLNLAPIVHVVPRGKERKGKARG